MEQRYPPSSLPSDADKPTIWLETAVVEVFEWIHLHKCLCRTAGLVCANIPCSSHVGPISHVQLFGFVRDTGTGSYVAMGELFWALRAQQTFGEFKVVFSFLFYFFNI